MYRSTVLDNGIRIATRAMPGVRSLSLGVMVDAGPADEGPGQEGLAHLCEHLLFQGTASRSALDIARLMDGAGGQVGGFVTRDYTCYHATVLDDYRYHALDLLGDVLLNSTFPEAAVRRQQETVVCEIEAALDLPAARARALAASRAWGSHPLGRPVAGTPETVRALTREDLIYFAHRCYTPDRIVIAAAGSLDHDDLVAQSRDALWRLMGEGRPGRLPPPRWRGGLEVEENRVTQCYFALGVEAPPFAHRDRYPLHVLAQVLGGGVSSRLFHRLREERALVYDVGAEYSGYRDGGLLTVEGSTRPENLEPVLHLALLELARLATGEDPVRDEELERAVTQLTGRHLIASENSHVRMSRLATQALYFGRHLPDGEVLAAIRGIDPERLGRASRDWLLPGLGRPALAVVGPEATRSACRRVLGSLLEEVGAAVPPPALAPTPAPAATFTEGGADHGSG